MMPPNASAASSLGVRCSCGGDHAAADHTDPAQIADALVEHTLVRALLPHDATRRRVLGALGSSTLLSALAAAFPLGAAKEAFAQGGGKPEKTKLAIGFIPITCATPIIMAHPMAFYTKYGLEVDVVKTAGWAVIRDKTLNKEYDAAHMLSPMPLAITLGAGATPQPYTMPAVENINGQAITLAMKHKDRRDPKSWKGLKFAVPFDYSMHNYLLRYYVCGGWARPRHGHPDPRRAAARDGRESSRREYRRLPRTRSSEPARGIRWRRIHPSSVEGDLGRPSLLRVRREQGIRHE
jgi:hypothetical protein